MLKLLLWLVLLVLCWPFVWLVSLPFLMTGIAAPGARPRRGARVSRPAGGVGAMGPAGVAAPGPGGCA